MHVTARLLLGATAALALARPAAPASPAATTPPPDPRQIPVEAFFEPSGMSEVRMSPDGSALSMLVRNQAGRRQLAVVETADLSKAKVVASLEDYDIENAQWVDDRRLIFMLADEAESALKQNGSGLFAVDRDGGNFRLLIRQRGRAGQTATFIKSHELPAEYDLVRTLSDGSGDVIIAHWIHTSPLGQRVWQITGTTPLRLNTRTGLTSDAIEGRLPNNVQEWVVDADGHVRVAVAQEEGRTRLLRPGKRDVWEEIDSFDAYGIGHKYEVDGATADGQVYVSTATSATGGAALFRLDRSSGKRESAPLVDVKGFDVDAKLVEDAHGQHLLGVRYQGDAEGTAWFDPALKALQAKVDARLPGLVNRIEPARCGCSSRALVTSFSDRQPPLFFLFDGADASLVPVGSQRPRIAPLQMAYTDFVRIQTRDAHDLPIYVTKPHGKGPWPTVILVHGGPFVRGWHWDWDGESQFLASRGYLVVKPEFRGSQGYGWQHFVSGFKQWGLAMQDDIADATRWAAQQGLEDPKRTCIAGASYGGYATLMGLVRYPELYRCGVAWSVVTDVNLMYDINWSDMSTEWHDYGMPLLVGDPVKDAAQLQANSPLQQAARITRPLLLAHGGVDRRVPIKHATALRDALQAHHAPLTWIEYADEAHGWRKPETRVAFYAAMERFLAVNLGAPAETGAASAPAP